MKSDFSFYIADLDFDVLLFLSNPIFDTLEEYDFDLSKIIVFYFLLYLSKFTYSLVYDYEFFVFDRWGELIFQTTNTDEGWDGTYKGEKCQQDVYVYKIRYFDIVENLPHQKAGTFSLIR